MIKSEYILDNMINAKQEFLNATEGLEIEAAVFNFRRFDKIEGHIPTSSGKLKLNYTQEDLNEFLNALDFDYHSGYGIQELFGTIWYKDGRWSIRGEYDGSEWWELQERPEISEFM